MMPPARKQVSSQWMILQGVSFLLVGGVLAFSAIRHNRAESESAPAAEPDLGRQAIEHLEQRKYRPLTASLDALLSDERYKPVPTQTHPLLGQPAPDFTLPDTDGVSRTLAEELKQRPVVLVFYYGYACDHCVSQLFALNNDLEKFRELDATIWAVSADPPELTRKRFKQYGAFGYPVLSDPDHAVATKYSTYLPNPKPGEDGDMMHGTFVIDRSGRILWANRGDQPFTENRTLLIELHRSAK
ncbi:MAG: redoxin domain-containing protein [Gemmataceae bacterium]